MKKVVIKCTVDKDIYLSTANGRDFSKGIIFLDFKADGVPQYTVVRRGDNIFKEILIRIRNYHYTDSSMEVDVYMSVYPENSPDGWMVIHQYHGLRWYV